MASKKHLVLEDDVYLKLKRRKTQTKLSVKAIGNSILRRALSRPPLPEAIGDKLVKMGKVSKEEYEQAVTEAIKDSQKIPAHVSEIIKPTDRNTFVAGSWEFKELCRSQDGAFQVLECWARDETKTFVQPHSHSEFEYFIVVAGRVQFESEMGNQVLTPTDSLCIPPERLHSNAPLTKDTRALVVSMPAMLELS